MGCRSDLLHASAGLIRPACPGLTWMVDQSVGRPCPPSLPVTSMAILIFSRCSGSSSRLSVSLGPPDDAQLGINEASVVHPGRYGYVSSVMSAPFDLVESIISTSSGARPLFSSKLSVACVRSANQLSLHV